MSWQPFDSRAGYCSSRYPVPALTPMPQRGLEQVVWSPRLEARRTVSLAFGERDVSGLVRGFLAGCLISEYAEVDGGLIFEMQKWMEEKNESLLKIATC